MLRPGTNVLVVPTPVLADEPSCSAPRPHGPSPHRGQFRGLIWGSPPSAVPSLSSVSRWLRPRVCGLLERCPCCLPLALAAARTPLVPR